MLNCSIDKLTSILEDERAKYETLEAAIDKHKLIEAIAEKKVTSPKYQGLISPNNQAMHLPTAERVRECETRSSVCTEKFQYKDAAETK